MYCLAYLNSFSAYSSAYMNVFFYEHTYVAALITIFFRVIQLQITNSDNYYCNFFNINCWTFSYGFM